MTPLFGPPPVSYYKRYRMECALAEAPPVPPLPPGFRLVPWDVGLIPDHAETLVVSFHETVDAIVFPSLSDRAGCVYLMNEICRKPGFLPGATWLLSGPDGFCGSVQGVREAGGVGAIQNLGVVPGLRGRGLGTLLLLQAVDGFRQAGLKRALLEVTSQNEAAIRLYRRLGFRKRKTVYKVIPAPTFV